LKPLLEVQDVRKAFYLPQQLGEMLRHHGKRAVYAVDGVSLTVGVGQTVGLVGESGSGKTTLGRMILGLIEPTSGTILFEGADIAGASRGRRFLLRRDIQVVFQDPYASLDPRQRVARIIREPLDIHRIGTPTERRQRVREMMDLVALPQRYASAYPHQLSGGLRQRVSIATALSLSPKLLVADEAVSALDVSVQAQILDLLETVKREMGIGLLFISHDLGVIHQISDYVAVMRLGKLVEAGPVDQVYESPQHMYTQALLSAIPPADPTAHYKPLVPADELGG